MPETVAVKVCSKVILWAITSRWPWTSNGKGQYSSDWANTVPGHPNVDINPSFLYHLVHLSIENEGLCTAYPVDSINLYNDIPLWRLCPPYLIPFLVLKTIRVISEIDGAIGNVTGLIVSGPVGIACVRCYYQSHFMLPKIIRYHLCHHLLQNWSRQSNQTTRL